MSTIRRELVYQAVNKAWSSLDYNIHKGFHVHFEFIKQKILADSSLTEDEKNEAIRLTNKDYDRDKISYNSGTRRTCENCNKECLATLYCEYCVQDYLKARFSNWTSGNNDIDNLIQKCQSEMLTPDRIVEWIPYNNLMNIKYLTKGGFSKIYTADWINGPYKEWDSKKQQLERIKVHGIQNFVVSVILKELENIEGASQSWFEEAKSHLNIGSKYPRIVDCYGLTQNPSNENYMLVMNKFDVDLREYLLQNNNQLTWKERIKIAFLIIEALYQIHEENSIHRDLHSGNILYSQLNNSWCISDLGFCGPVDKSPKSIYGNLSYIAPEIISGRKYTFASDIYSIAMLMWEISSGRPPFNNHENGYYLAMNTVNGIRPRIVPGTPLEYKNLMKQCWDADPLMRPDIVTLRNKISGINALLQNTQNELDANSNFETNNLERNYTSSRLFTSKVHQFENFPEPRNATEEEQEAFHSKSYKFSIPNNINDFNISNNQSTSKSNSISKVFNNLKINSKNDIFKEDAIQQQIKRQDSDVNDMQIEEFASEQSVSQTEQITIIDNKNEGKGKSKRIYSEDEKEDLTDDNKSKKIKLNSNKANFQYIQRNYIADDDENDISNNPNLHSKDQDEFEIPEDGFE
ncbi:kinase-like protein [Rhizophagus irregularis]|uniref:Kinase-like protein n=2 Tax=Rhizophagus irregularis TaxID=588596 RepID=A0A2N1NC64_9GLOM|nr:kinase-like protein [Rhizophagus irregularis]